MARRLVLAACVLASAAWTARAEDFEYGIDRVVTARARQARIMSERRNANSKAIYENLAVAEESAVGPAVRTTFVKRVGGLDCRKTSDITPPSGRVSYFCFLNPSKLNSRAIYDALDVADSAGAGQDPMKSVGGLTCVKRTVGRGANYSCDLSR